MTTFKITYANGNTTEVNSSLEKAEEVCMQTFGLTPEEAAEHGCSVEVVEPDSEQESTSDPETETSDVTETVHITRGVSEESQAGDSTS